MPPAHDLSSLFYAVVTGHPRSQASIGSSDPSDLHAHRTPDRMQSWKFPLGQMLPCDPCSSPGTISFAGRTKFERE
jgi:hypothetical protein